MDALAPVKVMDTPDGRQWVSLSDYLVLVDKALEADNLCWSARKKLFEVLDSKVSLVDGGGK